MRNFLELQYLVDYLVDCLELSVLSVLNYLIYILFDGVSRGLGHYKNILLDTIYIVFS